MTIGTRDYGLSSYLKVYLYNYDVLKSLTDIKIHTNTSRIDGKEEIPEWYFFRRYRVFA